MADAPWVGEWKFESVENPVGNIYNVLGYPPNMADIFNQNKGEVMYKVVQEGDGYTSTFSCAGSPPATEHFVLGKEYTHKEMDGTEVKKLFEWNPETGILVETKKAPKYTLVITKLYKDGRATLTMEAEGSKNITTWVKA